MELEIVPIVNPDELNLILGQSHFIKTVEDLYETMVTAVPGCKFGLAFCEASGPALVRSAGTDEALTRLAEENALALSTGHAFILMLGEGLYPINVLNQIKMNAQVCRIYCATANPVQVIVAQTDQGRGILGVVDGIASKGVEGPEDVQKRREFLRMIGYKQ